MVDFSVVIPLYNKAGEIENTLRSVLAQTHPPKEIIVVDDGSEDGGAELVQALNIQNLRVLGQENAGVSVARNRGMEEAQCAYIALLDADDTWKPALLEKLAALIEKYPGCGLYACNYEFLSDGRTWPAVHPTGGDFIIGLDRYFGDAQEHLRVWTSAVVLRRSVVAEQGGFDPGLAMGEDIRLWAKIMLAHPAAYCDQVLATYNKGAANMASHKAHVRADSALADLLERAIGEGHKSAPAMKRYLVRARLGIYTGDMLSGQRAAARNILDKAGISRLRKTPLKIITRLPAKWVVFSLKIAAKLGLL